MNIMIRQLTICLALTTLCACADVVEGSRANINVTTAPPMNVTCTLTNSQGSIGVFTPNNAIVRKSKTDIVTTCTDPNTGARGESRTESDIEPWVFGNILWGLASPIALGVDLATGAANDYPQAIVVPMSAPQPQTYYAPNTTVITPYSTAPATYSTAPSPQPHPIQETVPTVSSTIPAQTYYFNPARAGTSGN